MIAARSRGPSRAWRSYTILAPVSLPPAVATTRIDGDPAHEPALFRHSRSGDFASLQAKHPAGRGPGRSTEGAAPGETVLRESAARREAAGRRLVASRE